MRTVGRSLAILLGALALGACEGTAASPGDGGAMLPACVPVPAMPAATFCALFVPSCGTSHVGFASAAACASTYGALTTTKPMQQACLSRHLCQALDYAPGADRDNHCTHATGVPGNGECELPD